MRDPKADGDRLNVLLLEDDDADAFLTRRALAAIPRVAQVARAKDGQQAMELLQSGKFVPDIAFVDLQMPTMDGFDFLSASTDEGLANIPMVVLTSSSAVNDALRSRVRGALRVITKPENPADLQRALQEAIDAFTTKATFSGWPQQISGSLAQEPPRERPAAPPAPSVTVPQFGRRAPR